MVWIEPLGFEVSNVVNGYVELLLKIPNDPSLPRIGTYEEKSAEVHLELKKPKIKRNVRKAVE